jgi:fatty acid synthase subunit alpha
MINKSKKKMKYTRIVVTGCLTTVDGGITAHCITIMNCADCDLIAFMEFMVNHCDSCKGKMYATARKLGLELFPTAPHTKITEKGEIVYVTFLLDVCPTWTRGVA